LAIFSIGHSIGPPGEVSAKKLRQRMVSVTVSTANARRGIWLVAGLTIICLGAVISIVVGREYASGDSRTVTVMTRNIYLGGNINRPIQAALGRPGREGVLALGHANHKLREVVARTDFRIRSKLLAAEIAATHPDLIALQEVALWRHGPMQLDHVGRPDATQVDYDFLAMLLADLANRGVRYEVVHVQQLSDVEAPAFTGNPYAGTAGSAADVRLTDRDVILVRSEAALRIEASGGGQYQQRFEVQLGDTIFSFVRGYAWADVAVGSARIRFVNTHLESQSARLARAQAEEMLIGPAGDPSLPTVIACDCNSNPASLAARSSVPIGSGAAYRLITDGHGYTDLWLQQEGSDGPGNTAWLGELVNDETADFERRVDLVLARSATTGQIVANRAEVTGDELSDRDPVSTLWPSDHAGVVVELRIG
jgi:endonuclease/exonuclease/phosphatase family metal-dependent hydrolase